MRSWQETAVGMASFGVMVIVRHGHGSRAGFVPAVTA
jgi:hypothetical protein